MRRLSVLCHKPNRMSVGSLVAPPNLPVRGCFCFQSSFFSCLTANEGFWVTSQVSVVHRRWGRCASHLFHVGSDRLVCFSGCSDLVSDSFSWLVSLQMSRRLQDQGNPFRTVFQCLCFLYLSRFSTTQIELSRGRSVQHANVQRRKLQARPWPLLSHVWTELLICLGVFMTSLHGRLRL